MTNVDNKEYVKKMITDIHVVQFVLKNIFGSAEIEIIKRPASFIIRSKKESEDKITRIIVLQPYGFTGNKIDETNPHPEARKATIEIKGAIREGSKRFHILKDAVKFQYYTTRKVEVTEEEPYPKIMKKGYKKEIKSARERFFVVKESGFGFYHSLVNLTDEWLVLILKKELKEQKEINIIKLTEKEDNNTRKIIEKLYNRVLQFGDEIFVKDPKLVDVICKLETGKILPTLIEMLNVSETGKHEACTIYAIILKVGRKDKKAITYLEEAIKEKSAPKYYLTELIQKLSI